MDKDDPFNILGKAFIESIMEQKKESDLIVKTLPISSLIEALLSYRNEKNYSSQYSLDLKLERVDKIVPLNYYTKFKTLSFYQDAKSNSLIRNNLPPKPNLDDIDIGLAILEDYLFELKIDTSNSEQLKVYKLLKCRLNNPHFEEDLALFFRGGEGIPFPRRSDFYIRKLFKQFGHVAESNISNNGFWVEEA